MGRELEYIPRIPISTVENEIALLEAHGHYDQAEGLRSFFAKFIREDKIVEKRSGYEKVMSEMELKANG